MNLSSTGTAASMTSAFLSEPPLSPGPAPAAGAAPSTVEPAATPIPALRTVDPAAEAPAPEPQIAPVPAPTAVPAPAPERTPDPAPSLESTLLRMRLLTPDQVAHAMREEAETGRPLAEIVVMNGWISADDLARLQAPAGAVAVPAPETVRGSEPQAFKAPVAAPAPAPSPAGAPASTLTPRDTAVGARVLVRLETGERIEVGDFDGPDTARKRARALMAELRQAAEWPFLSGRYVRPDAIVSIDIDLTGF